jgi:hypothetical protein
MLVLDPDPDEDEVSEGAIEPRRAATGLGEYTGEVEGTTGGAPHVVGDSGSIGAEVLAGSRVLMGGGGIMPRTGWWYMFGGG